MRMKSLVASVVLVAYSFASTGCASSRPPSADTRSRTEKWDGATNTEAATRPEIVAGPCADSLYVALKSKPLDAMTDREYAYFVEKDRLCSQRGGYDPNVERLTDTVNRWYNLEVAGLFVCVVAAMVWAATYDDRDRW